MFYLNKTLKEIDDKNISYKPFLVIKEYIINHPNVVYKGVPLVIGIYIIYPVIFLLWGWLPWVWACWEIYNKIPQPIVNYFVNSLRIIKIII
jgi:hypothetical protein